MTAMMQLAATGVPPREVHSESRAQEMNHAMKMGEEWGELQRKQEFDGGRRTGLPLSMLAGKPAV